VRSWLETFMSRFESKRSLMLLIACALSCGGKAEDRQRAEGRGGSGKSGPVELDAGTAGTPEPADAGASCSATVPEGCMDLGSGTNGDGACAPPQRTLRCTSAPGAALGCVVERHPSVAGVLDYCCACN